MLLVNCVKIGIILQSSHKQMREPYCVKIGTIQENEGA